MENSQLEKLLNGNKSSPIVKVYFGQRDTRFPMMGKFVACNDAKDLQRKGMARFVNSSRLDYWSDEQPMIGLTKIYVLKDFSQFKIV